MEEWADANSLSLIDNSKLPKSFNNAIWKKGYNLDFIFVSSNISDMFEKSILDLIPYTQHKPICVTVNPVIVPQPTTPRRHFDLKIANWVGFTMESHAAIEEVKLIPENYGRFKELLRVVSRRHIPRECRSNCIQKTVFKEPLWQRYTGDWNKADDTMKEQNRNK